MEIKDKVIIVTGASSGIGLAAAKLLAQHGAKVALVARSEDKLKRISKELPDSLAVRADMANRDDIIEMIRKVKKHFGRIDVLINNAGQGYDAPIEKTNLETFHKIFDLDVVGPVVAMQQVIPILRKHGGGLIINVSSGTALRYLPNMAAYSSLKRALASISLTAREELKKDNIGVSVVFPYITLTDFEKNTIRDFVEDQEPEDGDSFERPAPDRAEFVAQKILDCIKNEEAEVFAHDWMKRRG
jgi:short-subunit dehydrogenase